MGSRRHAVFRDLSMADEVLTELSATIRARRSATADASYTRSLLDGGVERCARKFGEEAVEAIVAALGADDQSVKSEAADVVFHLLVLLEARRIAIEDVLQVLAQRQGVSGHAEKASRQK
jgi:phosphoribosyl-ATP pyrophosphohydrolase